MKKTNALELRQHMGRVISQLQKSGEPILLERNRKPVGVLISLEDFQTRFVDKHADMARNELIDSIRSAKLELPEGKSSLDLIRELRS